MGSNPTPSANIYKFIYIYQWFVKSTLIKPIPLPAQQLSADINAAQTVTINLGWLKGRTVGGFIEHDEDAQARGG